MQNTQITAERIKLQAKAKGISAKKVLEICELGPNTITKMSNGSDIVSQSLRKIADYLDCSVDYLLGRTDNPNLTGGAYINGDNNNNGQQAINGNVTVNSSDDSSDTSDDKQLLDMIKELDIVDRSKIIIQIDEMKNKKTSPMSGAN